MSCNELPAYRRLPLDVVAAVGAELLLADGGRVLDLYGGHCVNTLGAGDPDLGREIEEQWKTLSFATNLFDHAPRLRFLQAFGATTPPGDWSVFLSNSGAEANENALKAALTATGRAAVVCFHGAFHGRTAATTAVSDTKHVGFPRAPCDVRRIPLHDRAAAASAVDGDVACVILEPLQSLAGVVDAGRDRLLHLRELCDASGALLVYDEVQTGNGRLGVPWASQAYGVVPDIFTTAKGAAGGLPIGITALSGAVAARVDPALFGSTFGGGPTVLAAAACVARRLAAPGFLENVRATSDALRRAASRGPVARVRGRGLLLGLELVDGVRATDVRDALLREGVLVGTTNDPRVLRLTPPLSLRPEQAELLGEALERLEVMV